MGGGGMKVLGGMPGLARIAIAGVGLAYAIAAALGSGVGDLLTMLGLDLDAAQRVLAGTVVFGAALMWDNALLRRRLFGHANAPFIAWVDPAAHMNTDGSISLQVWCENAGPRDSEAVTLGSFVESSRKGETFTDKGVKEWSRILSRKNGDQHRFIVHMLTVNPETPWFGEREIAWGLFYFDATDRDKVYVSACSVRIDAQAVGPVPIPDSQQWLDATSTPHERMKRLRDKKYTPLPWAVTKK